MKQIWFVRNGKEFQDDTIETEGLKILHVDDKKVIFQLE